jgi:hypothetical protein
VALVALVALVAQREIMIEIECRDGWWIIKAPKMRLVLTKAQFIEALRRGRQYRRREQQQARLQKAAR